MAGLIPFNLRNKGLTRTGFEDFYNVLDDFFSDGLRPSRNLLKDTFKIDILEKDTEYLVEAEIPGVTKEEIDLNVADDTLSIMVNRTEEVNKDDGKNYIHRERRTSSMSRSVRLADAKLDEVKAKLEEGILTVTIPKNIKENTTRKIDIE